VSFRDLLRWRKIGVRHAPRVEFLGEQDGPLERQLKSAIVPLLSSRKSIQGAYLARVGFQPNEAGSIALCIVSVKHDESLVPEALEQFRSLFSADAFLDILFLSREQSLDVARVCAPFFSRAI
jgi:hypothetical protein